jgi:uncharacterized protein YjiS (DUF1127 family)
MNIHRDTFAQFTDVTAVKPHAKQALGARIRSWLRTCAAYFRAGQSYEELSRLSDAELARRGLSRTDLGRDLCKTCETDQS